MLKLNLGCGKKTRPGYVNIDIRKTTKNVIVGDVRNLKYKDGTVDEIYANDVYEHVSFLESLNLLTHWVSKLKTGGRLILQTPDINGLISYMQKQTDPEGIQKALRRIFGGQDYKYNYHFTAGHPVLMKHLLKKAGITGSINISTKGTNMKVEATK
jgi:predicted SAM-dependent methyltransferase